VRGDNKKEIFHPSYLKLYKEGILQGRVAEAKAILKSCRLCPRNCEVDRAADETGYCRTGIRSAVSNYSPHFGEEAPLVGTNGSGTIFFTHCNLLCLFCQNYEISHLGEGRTVAADQLARMMLDLQEMGCHNINFVSPSHVAVQILEALPAAIAAGLNVPLILIKINGTQRDAEKTGKK
jgi:putative pyruvate formate lyase activating enzyme